MTPPKPSEKPWSVLAGFLDQRDEEGLSAFLDSLEPIDVVRSVSRLSDDQRTRLFELVRPEAAAELLERIPETQAVDALETLEPDAAARILEELPSDAQADLIGEIDAEEAEAILSEMLPDEAREVRELAAYPEGTAGSLMITEYLRFEQDLSTQEVLAQMRERAEEYADYDVQYGYVVDERGVLVGVLRLRDLLLSRPGRRIASMMILDPHSVRLDGSISELTSFFDEHRFYGAPVLDREGRMMGVVRRAAVTEAVAEESEEAFRQSQGIVGGEELRSMPLLLRSRRRLSWLSVNIALNVCAASVIAAHQGTLESVIALAVFLPIISDMSGCSGNQAVAVSIRELTLGVISPKDIGRVLRKEATTGTLNGLVLGALVAAVAWAWNGNPWLGLVTGGALALNTVFAACIGGTVPLLIKRSGRDPALASGPILTTCTDAVGFMLVLGFASAALARLA